MLTNRKLGILHDFTYNYAQICVQFWMLPCVATQGDKVVVHQHDLFHSLLNSRLGRLKRLPSIVGQHEDVMLGMSQNLLNYHRDGGEYTSSPKTSYDFGYHPGTRGLGHNHSITCFSSWRQPEGLIVSIHIKPYLFASPCWWGAWEIVWYRTMISEGITSAVSGLYHLVGCSVSYLGHFRSLSIPKDSHEVQWPVGNRALPVTFGYYVFLFFKWRV